MSNHFVVGLGELGDDGNVRVDGHRLQNSGGQGSGQSSAGVRLSAGGGVGVVVTPKTSASKSVLTSMAAEKWWVRDAEETERREKVRCEQ